MSDATFERYSRNAAFKHFHGGPLPPLLRAHARPGVIADLGCGDGTTARALLADGLLGERTYLVDLSPERVAAAVAAIPGGVGIVGNASDVAELPDGSVDGVVAGQLIEHLPDDATLAPELARLLRPGGWWYVGTVLKARHGWWIYRVDGSWRLDPTHVREYASEAELRAVLAHPQLRIDAVHREPLRFPLTDLAARALATARVLGPERISTLYLRSPLLRRLRRIRTPLPPGYSLIEVAGTRL